MDAEAGPLRKRTPLIWAIGLFYLVLFGAGSIFVLVMLFVSEPPPYMHPKTHIQNTLGSTGIVLNLFGAIYLLKLRRIAFYLFAIALAMAAVLPIWRAVTTGISSAIDYSDPGILISWATEIAVCWYTWLLAKRGVLE
jgi:hypothetical protein